MRNILFLTDVSFFVFQKVLENITIFRFKSSEFVAFSNERKLIVYGRIFISNFFLEYKEHYCLDETEILVINYVVSKIKKTLSFENHFKISMK